MLVYTVVRRVQREGVCTWQTIYDTSEQQGDDAALLNGMSRNGWHLTTIVPVGQFIADFYFEATPPEECEPPVNPTRRRGGRRA